MCGFVQRSDVGFSVVVIVVLQNVQYSLVDVFGFEQANSVAAAMRGALVEPLLVVVPDIACRAEEAQVRLERFERGRSCSDVGCILLHYDGLISRFS